MNSHFDLPCLETLRCRLDGFTEQDVPVVQHLAGDFDIARMTELIPHPYPDGAAQAWIATHQQDWVLRRSVNWAVRLRDSDCLLGAISLHQWRDNRFARLGFWLGKAYWGRGYTTEAAVAVVKWRLQEGGLWRIESHHRKTNPASGAVQRKAGLKNEGCLRGAFYRFGECDDMEVLGIVRSDLLS